MFLVNVKEALGYSHEKTLDSSYVLITGLLQEYAYLCHARNRALTDENEEEGEEYEWVEMIDFKTGKTKRYKKYKKIEI